jgi:hypothetical protein
MKTAYGVRTTSRKKGRLHAECITLSGRSDVFTAESIRHSRDNIVLVSKKAVKTGTNLVVRMLDFPPQHNSEDCPRIRAMGLVEVLWVDEVMIEDGLAYEIGMRYVYTD